MIHERTAPVNSGQLRRIIDFPRKPFAEDIIAVKEFARGTRLKKETGNFGQRQKSVRMAVATSMVRGAIPLVRTTRLALRLMLRGTGKILVGVCSLSSRHQEDGNHPKKSGKFETGRHNKLLIPPIGEVCQYRSDKPTKG